MSEQNKKSGFWSWLGRSKNKDQIQQSIENESIESEQQNTTVELQQVQNEQQNLTEIAVKTTEDVLVEQEQSNEIEDGEQNFFIQEQEKPFKQGGFLVV